MLIKQPPTPCPHVGPTNSQSHCCDIWFGTDLSYTCYKGGVFLFPRRYWSGRALPWIFAASRKSVAGCKDRVNWRTLYRKLANPFETFICYRYYCIILGIIQASLHTLIRGSPPHSHICCMLLVGYRYPWIKYFSYSYNVQHIASFFSLAAFITFTFE